VVAFGSCADTTTAQVAVTPSPSVNLGNNQTICSGDMVTLNAGNSGGAYLWNTGATTQSITVSGAGTYWVFVALNNCGDQDTVSTFIAPAVKIPDSSLCTVSPIVLDPGSGATSYLWSDGSTSQTISVETGGTYWVVATFGSCTSRDSAKITGDGMDGQLYIPNAFTPNGDFLNDVFMAKGTAITSFDMNIFDRWGNLIFTSDDIDRGWNGKIEGGHYLMKQDGKEVSQEDVYIWKINYTTQCFPDRTRREMGSVTLVK
jgi:gliding motility-associated-like protein